MSRKIIIGVFAILSIVVFVLVAIQFVKSENTTDQYSTRLTQSHSENPQACTQEAKLCPDGKTYVNRTESNCEFEKCPDIFDTMSDKNKSSNLDSGKSEVISKSVKFNNSEAYVDGDGILYLVIDGKKIIVDKARADGKSMFFDIINPRFSPYGRYLIYEEDGYELHTVRIYDTKTLKRVSVPDQYSDFDASHTLFFTDNEDYLVGCSNSGSQSGPGGWVYAIPTLANVFNLNPYIYGHMSVSCMLKNNIVIFSLFDSYAGEDKEIKFSLKTKKVEISK